ncbi:MAG: adenosine-specific kinase [Methanobacterium sp.]|jgi:adenosine/AMP kinase|nr:adenosine-specific kinase [Methanobacterium sp.]
MGLELINYQLAVPEDCNLILGQSHFIKTVEDLYEAIVNTVPQAEFGLAFGEASGDCLVRKAGNNNDLTELAAQEILNMACGHSFLIYLKNAFPINVTQRIKSIPEVVGLFCATSNPVQVLIVKSEQGNGIVGVIDGLRPVRIEDEEDAAWRLKFLRDIGYKF